MVFNLETDRRMPIRLPEPEAIRRMIAEKAADVSTTAADRYLELLGPVEPSYAVQGEAPWRLSYYGGSREQNTAIERAVGMVQRITPLMRAA